MPIVYISPFFVFQPGSFCVFLVLEVITEIIVVVLNCLEISVLDKIREATWGQER